MFEVKNISMIYDMNTDEKMYALKGFDLELPDKGLVGIIGPSGSGKSTLLHILGGVDKPTEGKVLIDGTDIHCLSEDKLAIFRRRQIGLVYQFYNLMPVLNIDENIALPHLLDGRPLDKERLDQIVDQKYAEGIIDDGYSGSVAYGICFCKKSCIVGRMTDKD